MPDNRIRVERSYIGRKSLPQFLCLREQWYCVGKL